ncbi:MAG: SPOR domain-containing protein, partial [Bacteroidetes bacterium]
AKTTAKGKLVTGKNFQPYGLYKIELRMPDQSGFGVQVGVFTQVEGALKEIANLQGQWFDNILLNIEKAETGETVYKIILGPFENQDSANAYKTALKKKKINGFVVPLSAAE